MRQDVRHIFGMRLREARELKKISQRSLGLSLGWGPLVAVNRMHRYENEKRLPRDLKIAEKLAEALGVPMAYLFATDERIARLLLLWNDLDDATRDALCATASHQRLTAFGKGALRED
ncbi:MAG: helix-turn-helix domain-containing protein [Magnetococcus sp. MYC-9]